MPDPCNRPNFIVVTTDQQRYDTLGVTGNRTVSTPNFDALAGGGTLFTRAYTQNTVCIPARACLHTGRYTHQHGCQYMEAEIDTTPVLPHWETTFMERLQAAGYRTGACGKIHMMEPKGYHETQLCGGKGARWTQPIGQDIGPGPLGQQYAAWLEERRPGGYMEIYKQRQQPEYKARKTAIVNVLEEDEYVDWWIAEMAREFMQRRRQEQREPWMLWIGFCGPHGPMDPPRRYAEMYPVEEMPIPDTYTSDLADKPQWMRRPPRGPVSDEERITVQRVIAYYYAMMTQIDDMVGRVLQTLEEQGFADNTVIITTSDHGEMLGDFGRMGKGVFLEPVVHIPTICHVPEPLRSAAGQPATCDAVTETFSVAATVLDYAGIEAPPEMQAPSLRPILQGEADGARGMALTEYVDNNRGRAGVCLTTERHKYCNWGADCIGELYDLQEDPGELRNLWEDPGQAPVRQEMADLLLDRMLHSMEPAYTSFLRKLPAHVENPAWGRNR